jgi:hypothetical protein
VLNEFPDLFTREEINSLDNLRGIPNELNNELHLQDIRDAWDDFYNSNPDPTRRQFFAKRDAIDREFGCQFNPPM